MTTIIEFAYNIGCNPVDVQLVAAYWGFIPYRHEGHLYFLKGVQF